MINNRRFVSHDSGEDVYAIVRDANNGYVWNTSGTPAFEAYDAGNYGDYAIACPEQGSSGTYEFTMPGDIPDAVVDIEFRVQDGENPAEGDTFLEAGVAAWIGEEDTFRTEWNTNPTALDGDPVDMWLEKIEKGEYDVVETAAVGATSVLVDEAPVHPVPGDFIAFQRPGTPMPLTYAVCEGAESENGDVRIHFQPPLTVEVVHDIGGVADEVILMAPRSVGRTAAALADEVDVGKVKGVAVSGVADFRATGFSTHSADDVWDVTAREVTGGTVDTLSGHTAQTGDAFAVVNHEDHGNAKLARSAIPANALAIDASGNVEANNMRGTDGAYTGTPPTADAIGTDAASKVLVTPENKLATDASGNVAANNMRGTNDAALASVCTETRLAELDAANLPADVDAVKATVDHADHGNAAILAQGNAAWVTATGFATPQNVTDATAPLATEIELAKVPRVGQTMRHRQVAADPVNKTADVEIIDIED